jgi:SAM-dependent methyltransferase
VSFDVAAESYRQFMGRYSEPLATEFLAFAGATGARRALDVGCGPGALTALLVERLGASAVAAIDPSESFVAAARDRLPGVDIQHGSAEALPYDDGEFDLALAQLVVHFMADPVAGLREMARVTRAGGAVAACVWDYAGGGAPLATFWQAVNELDPGAPDESGLAGAREGHLAQLFEQAGLRQVEATLLTVRVPMAGFDDWWAPFTLGVGPAGTYVARADASRVEQVRRRCAELLPDGPFEMTASAWGVRGTP